MKYFLKNMVEYKKTNDKDALYRASRVFDTSKLDQSIVDSTTKTAAIQLINTLDRIEKVDYEQIPQTLEENKWVYQKRSVSIDNKNYPVEISMIKLGPGSWRFSKKTLDTIGHFETSLIKNKVVKEVIANKDFKTK